MTTPTSKKADALVEAERSLRNMPFVSIPPWARAKWRTKELKGKYPCGVLLVLWHPVTGELYGNAIRGYDIERGKSILTLWAKERAWGLGLKKGHPWEEIDRKNKEWEKRRA